MGRDSKPDNREGRGRGEKKRAAQAVEKLAQTLVGLSDSAVAQLPISGGLLDELNEARRTTKHGSRRRQTKHFAGLLRRQDEERARLEEFLAGEGRKDREEVETFHHLERLRDALCDEATFESALAETKENLPSADFQKLSKLAISFHANKDKRAFRLTFRLLRNASQ